MLPFLISEMMSGLPGFLLAGKTDEKCKLCQVFFLFQKDDMTVVSCHLNYSTSFSFRYNGCIRLPGCVISEVVRA